LPSPPLGVIIWLRQMFTILQKEDRLLAVLRLQNGGVYLTCWVSDFTNARFARPDVANCERAPDNSVGRFQIAAASFSRNTKYTRSFTAPVLADGAGGSGIF
jgi:hypothetical protein